LRNSILWLIALDRPDQWVREKMSLHNRMAAVLKRSAALDADEAEQMNKRWAKRKATATPAKILFDGISTPYDCTLRDISSTGAQVEMTRTKLNPDGSADNLPSYFTLIMPLDKTAVECQSMWRRGSKVGARFVGMVRHFVPPKPPAAKGVSTVRKAR
jgi:hypothetical protein